MNKLKKIREKQGLTQTQLAHSAKTTSVTIRAIENKRHYLPSIETADKVAAALGVSIHDIFKLTSKR